MNNASLLMLLVLSMIITACVDADTGAEADNSTSTTTTTAEAQTTTTVASTSTTTLPPTTTTTTLPSITTDIVVVGDSIGGAGAVQALVEDGNLSVLWIPETGYTGGQASASGVSSFDDWDGYGYFQHRDTWPYSGIIDEYRETRREHDLEYGLSMFAGMRGRGPNFAPTAIEVRDYLNKVTTGDNVTVEFHEVTDVLVEDGKITGVMTETNVIEATFVVDATEYQDLYPMVDGLQYVVPECSQNTTWTAVRSEESTLYPAEDDLEALREYYGDEKIDAWLDRFSKGLQAGGHNEWRGWDDRPTPWDPAFEWQYRQVANGHSSLNHFNDLATIPETITDEEVREAYLLEAKAKTYVELWWLRWGTGQTDHGISQEMEYHTVEMQYNHPAIRDEIEQHFPPMTYVRQARTLADPTMVAADIADENRTRVTEEIDTEQGFFWWGYMADSHGCYGGDHAKSRAGMYPVDESILVQDDVEGFYPGMLRGARVDAVVASSLRMQPSEYIGGYQVGRLILSDVQSSS